MKDLKCIILKKSWGRKKKGQKLYVDRLRAETLVNSDIADYAPMTKKGDN